MKRRNRQRGRPARFAGAVGIVALCAVACGACANNSQSQPNRPPAQRAVDTCKQRVQRSVSKAFQSSESADPFLLSARFNPSRCAAPPFEVYAHGRWVRVYLDGSQDVRTRLQSFREESNDESDLRTLRLKGKFRGERRAESGLKYPVFWVSTIVSDGEAGPDARSRR